MILEIAQIEVKAGLESEFEKRLATTRSLFESSKGCRGVELRRSVERPGTYWLLVRWESVENHTVDFPASPQATELGVLIGSCLVSSPIVEHSEDTWYGF